MRKLYWLLTKYIWRVIIEVLYSVNNDEARGADNVSCVGSVMVNVQFPVTAVIFVVIAILIFYIFYFLTTLVNNINYHTVLRN